MANNLIQIKRSVANATVTGLANGELAYTQATDTLYIGSPDGNATSIPIGTRLNYGNLTASAVLVTNSSSYIDSIKVANAILDKITANGALGTNGQIMTSNSTGGIYWNVPVPATNVDAQFTWTNTHTFQNTITFNSTINGTANLALTANNANNLNSKSEANLNVNSAVTSNSTTYINGNTAGDLNTYASDKAANAYSNAMSDTLSRNGSYTGNNSFSGANTTFSGTNTNVTGFLKTANSDLASIKLRTASLIGGSYDRNEVSLDAGNQLVISGGNYGTQIRSANDGSSWFTLTLNPDTGALIPGANGTMNLGTSDKRFGTLYLAGNTIVLGNTTLSSNGESLESNNLSITGNATINNIVGTTTNVSSNLVISGANINATNSYLKILDVEVTGNLTVSGTLTTIDTTNLVVKDSMIKLADQNVNNDILDTGFYATVGNATSTYYTGLYRDVALSTLTAPVFKLYSSNVEPTSTVDTGAGTYLGTLKSYLDTGAFKANSSSVTITANSSVSANIVANSLNLSTALSASYGGTGLSTFVVGDILFANSTTTLDKLAIPASANGKVLQIVNNLPAYGTLDGGTF